MVSHTRRAVLMGLTTTTGALVLWPWHRFALAAVPDGDGILLRSSLFGMAATKQSSSNDSTRALTELFGGIGGMEAGKQPNSSSKSQSLPSAALYVIAQSPEANFFTFKPEDVSHALGIAGQIAAVGIAPFVAPGAAIALTIAGILTEPTLNYITKNPALTIPIINDSFLPPTTPTDLKPLNATLASMIASRYQTDANFADAVNNDSLHTQYGLNFDLLKDDAALIQEAAGTASSDSSLILGSLSDLRESQADETATIQKMRTSVDAALKHYHDAVLANSQNLMRVQQETERAAKLESLRQQSQEFVGVSNIAAFVIGSVLGDQSTARTVSGSVNCVADIYRALQQYDLNAIGGFALAGSTVGSISAFMSLASEHPTLF